MLLPAMFADILLFAVAPAISASIVVIALVAVKISLFFKPSHTLWWLFYFIAFYHYPLSSQ
jgi:hypothetical protein